MCNSSFSHGGASARNRQRLKISIPSLCSQTSENKHTKLMFTPQEIKLLQYFLGKEPDIEKQHRGRRRNESGTSGRGFTELQAPISSSAKARVGWSAR